MRKILLLFVFSLVCFSGLHANPVEFGISDIEYFNRRQYGGATQNWDISQAASGLLYFANNDGIIEYDGTNCRMLPMPSEFSYNITRSVLAHEGKIYIGATDEFGFFEPDSIGNFQYHSISEQYSIGEHGDFWSIFAINDQFVFQSLDALCIYTPGQSVEVVEATSRISDAFLVNGMLLVHDDSEGLMELRQGKLFRVPGGGVFKEKTIGAIVAVSDEKMVIGTMDDGLWTWDTNGIDRWEVPASPFLREANIFCGTNVGDDVAFGTIQSGMVVIDDKGNLKMIAGKDQGLNNNTVLSIFLDRQKNIWAGLDNGIARVGYNSAVSFLRGYFDLGTGYVMGKVENQFYLGTNQALYTISEEDFSDPTKNRGDFRMVKGTNGQVWSLFKDEFSDNFLMGHNLGVFHVEGQTVRQITPPSLNGAWGFRYVPGNKDLLLVGTYTGLFLLKRNGQNQWEYFRKVEGFNDSARFLEWDDDGHLWIAHGLKGLYKLKFDDSRSRVTEVLRNEDFEGQMTSYEGFSLSKIDGRIVFTSPRGVFSVNEENVIARDQLESYFIDKFPVRLKQDRFGNIWFFVDDGVGVLRYQEDGTFIKIDNPLFPLKNQLVSGFESVYVLDSQTAFFGIEDGFGQYSVTHDVNYYEPFNVHIRGFGSQAREDERFFVSSESGSREYIPRFSHGENDFEVSFSATWFGNGQVEYSTMLAGFEDSWSPWGLGQNRQFTRLSEGDYEFRVKARNVHDVQSKPAVFRFIVTPPWYRTSTAKIVYALLGIFLLVMVLWITHRIAEKSRQREKLRQREKYREREEQLRREALENEKEMIRLRNEKLRGDVQHKEKELANSTMHIIHKNDFLIKIKDELLKARKSVDKSFMDKRIASVIKQIDRDIDTEAHWEIFETHLEQVHEDFLKRLADRHGGLTAREMRLAAYLRMDMSSKEIASLMNITPRAVENNRYKLRKKLNLEQGDNLVDYIMKI